MRKGYKLRLLLVSFMAFVIVRSAYAQPWPNDPNGVGSSGGDVSGTEDDPSPDDDPGGGHGDPDLPIDSNVLILVAGVVGYGLKKVWDVKQKRKKSLQILTNYEDFVK